MSSKPRSDAKLRAEPQRSALIEWFTQENLSYAAARERLKKEFGISTSGAALSEFFSAECLLPGLRKSREFADQVAREMAESPKKYDTATIALVSKRAFEQAAAAHGDVKELKILAGIITGSKKLQLQERTLDQDREKTAKELSLRERQLQNESRRVALLEAKAKATAAVEETAKVVKLDAATKKQILDAIDKKLLGD